MPGRGRIVFYAIAAVAVALIALGAWNSRHSSYQGPPNGTAECKDRTISYAVRRQDACLDHGGVYAWNK